MFPYSKYVCKFTKKFGFHDNAITKLNVDGQILYIKSILELLLENKVLNPSDIFIENDSIHLNDIEPVTEDTKYWRKGDLFISIKHKSAIMHYRPSTNELINYIKGPFYQ